MTKGDRHRRTTRPSLAVTVLAAAVLTSGCPGAGSSVKVVKGSACGFYVNVGLFGGPQQLRGCGQPANAPPTGAAPVVTLPAEGSPTPIAANDPDGAAGVYGPATIMGGRWPCPETGDRNCPATAPPSGPMSVSTEGTLKGTVTSSAHIVLHPNKVPVSCYPGYGPNCYSPGGFGPFPVEGDELHVTCTASKSGTTGSVTFKNALHASTTDGEGSPKDQEPIPNQPPPNYVRSGVITNVGDVFAAVYNEQVHNPDGSLTVNGVHMYLFGPTAVGEVVKGQATCGRLPAKPPKDVTPPTCGTLVVRPVSPQDQTPIKPRNELVGVFDAGGLQAIENVQVTNGTVYVGDDTGLPHLKFSPGQTGPLPITAVRSDEGEAKDLRMEWSFDAVDKVGNRVHCPTVRAPDPVPNPAAAAASASDLTSTTATVATTATTSASGATTTSRPASTTTRAGAATTGGATTTAAATTSTT